MILKLRINNFFVLLQTHTQAEKKMLEARKEDMLKEFSEKNSSDISDLKRKLAELDLFKPHPYGTFHAVSVHI